MAGVMLPVSFRAKAQTEDDPWSEPVNLSKSGGATEPRMVVDSDGVVHVIWQDAFGDVIYTKRDQEGVWSDPVPVRFPYEDSLSTLRLVPDQAGFIHAFWITKQDYLYYSRTYNQGFWFSWSAPVLISYSASYLDAKVEPDRRIHIAYVKPDYAGPSPSGIYYRTSPNGVSWHQPVMLYVSPHFGYATPENTQLQLITNGQGKIYVAWEEGYQEKVFIMASDDGQFWSEPLELDRREE